ncbi:DUF4148 domain-containing protein [Caballeronia sp. BR00000012568055]|uniref:DUF4148 domain-containing protein n=1 Tax=Caballeronia sp. BR00000012568055 TaxID=2918761 RepID=UPI0023F737A6|nr:DUF4148 domain-containing protein [Caballeronia sp. BR00000012568055]
MKKLMCVVLATATLMPFAAFAQSALAHVTRAQVRAELSQLEAVGYRPSTHDADYPQALQSAEAKVAAMNAYGGANNSTQASGASSQ